MDIIDYNFKFKKMRDVGQLTTQCLNTISSYIQGGISTEDINNMVKVFGESHDLENAQYKYVVGNRTFPAYACISLNEVMCHGLPSEKDVLKDGDIVKVDVTFKKDGYHGDACRTFVIGNSSTGKNNARVYEFVEAARGALQVGISAAGPGVTLTDVGAAIEKYVKAAGFSVSKDFVGHGIGLGFHEWPQVPHYNDKTIYPYILKPGDTFTIEPIICMKQARYRTLKDGWTVVTRDKGLSAQFEATIGITHVGNEVFCR